MVTFVSTNQNKMKNLNYIPQQSEAKSVADYTPWELSEIDAYQNRNRGFEDDGEEDFENVFSWED